MFIRVIRGFHSPYSLRFAVDALLSSSTPQYFPLSFVCQCMVVALITPAMKEQKEAVIRDAVHAERKRLGDFIRRRVGNDEDAEDILQDVFVQLVTSYSVTEPIEQLTAWLFRVARNKIIDWYRKKKPDALPRSFGDENEPLNLADILYDPTQDPDKVYARSLVWTELADALDELPEEQREVFILHELEGESFKEMSERLDVPLNTLLSRKRYAVLHLRERLQELYSEMNTLS